MSASSAADERWVACAGCSAPVHADDRFCEACGARCPSPRDRVELAGSRLGAVSDRGVRHRHNEDAVGIRAVPGTTERGSARITVVCDGVSRGARPDLASQAAVDAALDVLVAGVADPDASTRAAVLAAAGAVRRLSDRAAAELPPACTFVSAVLVGHSATVTSVGDSRVYWLPRSGAGARPLTVDDSWRREAVAAGALSEAAASLDRRRHAITAWLGADSGPLDPHVDTVSLDEPGLIVACTDGLWNSLQGPDDLAALVRASPGDPLHVARRLVGEALDRAELDNITAAVIDVPAGTDHDHSEEP